MKKLIFLLGVVGLLSGCIHPYYWEGGEHSGGHDGYGEHEGRD